MPPPQLRVRLLTLIRTCHEGVLLFYISAPGTDPMSPVKLYFVAVVMGSAPQMRDIVYNHYTNSHKFIDPPLPTPPPLYRFSPQKYAGHARRTPSSPRDNGHPSHSRGFEARLWAPVSQRQKLSPQAWDMCSKCAIVDP